MAPSSPPSSQPLEEELTGPRLHQVSWELGGAVWGQAEMLGVASVHPQL